MAIRLDYTNMLADVVDGGVPVADWQQAEKEFGALRAQLSAAGQGRPRLSRSPGPPIPCPVGDRLREKCRRKVRRRHRAWHRWVGPRTDRHTDGAARPELERPER